MSGPARGARLCAVLAPALLAACASPPDTRYLASQERPALVVPAGLATPAYTQVMDIPRPGPGATPPPADVKAVEEIEKPPRRVLPDPKQGQD